MSRANYPAYSSTGSRPHLPYDDGDNTSYSHSDHDRYDPTTSYETSISSESDISPNDSASIPADRPSTHSRYQSLPRRPRPQHSPSHDNQPLQEDHPLQKTRHRRPPDQYSHSDRSRHAAYPHPASTPSDHSDISASVASHYDHGYSARGAHYDPSYDEQYADPRWPHHSAPYPAPPTMTSSTPSSAQYNNPAALATYEHYGYPGQHHSYATQPPSLGNPFMPTPPPQAPIPQPGYAYDPYTGAYQLQRPDMVARNSMTYMYPDMHHTAYPLRPYSIPQNMMQAMPPAYPSHFYPSHSASPVPDDKPAKPTAANEHKAPVEADSISVLVAGFEKQRLEWEEAAAAKAAAEKAAAEAKAVHEKELADVAAKAREDAEKDAAVRAAAERAAEKAAGEARAAREKELADVATKAREDAEKDAAVRVAAERAAEKAAAEAMAAREKELVDAATRVREIAEKDAAAATALAKAEVEKLMAETKAEHEKKMAEAKALADAAEAAKKAAEEELKKNTPGPDADKAPIKFTDAVDRSFTLPWHLVKTWKGMETLIRQAFVNIERIGPHVANGHYHLLGPNSEIILPQVWDTVVQPGWDIKMQLWPLPPDPIDEKVINGIGGFPPDIMLVPNAQPRRRPSRGNKVSGIKSAGKRASVGPAPPPPRSHTQPPVQYSSPPPPPMHMPTVLVGHDDLEDPVVFIEDDGRGRSGGGGGHKPKSSANTSKKKQVPAFTRWMLGGGPRPRPKGAEKPAAGVKIRHIVV
ncbi:hypothetical protein E4T47_04632 [Aureobasidium subglaciale]|nr:hypothetical protein E4T47_04632 [Aureobasidium subglaciale]